MIKKIILSCAVAASINPSFSSELTHDEIKESFSKKFNGVSLEEALKIKVISQAEYMKKSFDNFSVKKKAAYSAGSAALALTTAGAGKMYLGMSPYMFSANPISELVKYRVAGASMVATSVILAGVTGYMIGSIIVDVDRTYFQGYGLNKVTDVLSPVFREIYNYTHDENLPEIIEFEDTEAELIPKRDLLEEDTSLRFLAL